MEVVPLSAKQLPILGFSVLLVIVSALPSFAADKIRVAFSAVSPTQGVLWVADVGGFERARAKM